MAIRNIVFDLGNVLVDFDPPAYLLKCGFNAETAAHLLADVFSGAWQKGDAGDYLTVRALRDDLCKSHPDRKKAIRRALRPDCVRMHVLRPAVADWLCDLKKSGCRVYLLSNLAKYSHDYVRGYPFFRVLDGAVFSYRERVCKPDERIYRILLERYALVPEETVFLDDSAENVAAAERCGMQAIVFTDLAAAKAQLEALLQRESSFDGRGNDA